MMVLLISALYMLIFLWVSWRYVRTRDPLLRDVILVFATMAMLFVLGLLRLLVGELPKVLGVVISVMLLAQPLLTLRLVSRLRRVPRWLLVTAAAAWVASSAPLVAAPARLSPPAVWALVVTFFAGEVVAAALLVSEARRCGGAARIRLWLAAGGTAVFGTTMLFAGAGQAAQVQSRSLAVVSGLLYTMAFVPPKWLRRAWSSGTAYQVIRALVTAPADEPAAQTWQRYCRGAGEVLGADSVMLLLPTSANTLRLVTPDDSPLTGREYPERALDEMLAGSRTVDALAGWTHPPVVAVELAKASDTRFVIAAPLTVPDGRGALLLFSRYRSLFTDDDVSLFTELAGQAAALAQRATVLAERERLAVIVESSHDAIISRSLDGVITSWNAGAEQLYGYAAEEILGQDASVLFPADQQVLAAQLTDRVIRGERIEQYEIPCRRKDGATRFTSLTLSPITGSDGEITAVALMSRDINERRRAEAMFEGLLEAAPDAIIGVTRDGLISLINAEAERVFGYRRAELIGQSVDVLVPPRLRAQHPRQREHYFTYPKTRPMGAGAELTAVRKDGSEFPVEISLSALETDDGLIVSAAIRDVTERLIAQAERERLIAQTERDASDRRLQHMRRLESLGQLAGGVAHDFNNILAVISNYTELLQESLDPASPEPADLSAACNDLGQIGRAAERATQLTKQLLAFGRRDITQAEVLDLNHVIGDVEQMLRRTLGEHIHLITHLCPGLSPVYADASQIEQILVNLAVNARDAMPAGGTLSIDTSECEFDADDVADSPLAPGSHVRIRVSDTGNGMPADVIERAFEPFYTTKPRGSGTGLGLATVYGIATAAGGDVRLYSEAGIGTTVTILLPVVQATGVASARSTATDVSPDHVPDETILLVEDEDALRQVASRILTRAGYEVLVADGGDHAIHLAQNHAGPIDLLLTDVIMPNMMGNEVANRVQQIRPDVPVLYMSGYAQPVLTENGTLQPGVTIVEKPFTRSELLHRVQTVLSRRSAANHQRDPEMLLPPSPRGR